MLEDYFIARMVSLISSATTLFLYAGSAHAQACANSYKEAQDKEAAGHLLEAREQYSSCAKSACGPFLLNECTTRHARLDLDIPSVVPVATHKKSGKPYQHVQVTLDGQPFASSLDGRALQVDPGMHEFTFTTQSGTSVTEKALIMQGDRNRRIAVTMPSKHPAADSAPLVEAEPEAGHADATEAPAPATADHASASREPPNPAAPPKGVPALSWLLSGVGVLGGAGYVVFSSWGKKDNDALRRQCAPNCDPASVSQVKQRYLMADISLGVGIAGLGGAILVYALRGSTEEATATQKAYSVGVHPTRSGAVASFSGAF